MENNDQDKVWVTVSMTINTGNFENIKIEAGESKTIQEGEDPAELRTEIADAIIYELKLRRKELKKKKV